MLKLTHRKKIASLILLSGIITGIFFIAQFTYAEGTDEQKNGTVPYAGSDMFRQLDAFAGEQGANLGSPRDPRLIVAQIIKIFLSIVGTLATVYTIYGGYLVMTSSGEEEKIKKGKQIIFYGVLGVFIMLTSYSIAGFVWYLYGKGNENPYGSFFEFDVLPSQEQFYQRDPLEQSTTPPEVNAPWVR
ncbi:MAG: pilin [Candidatus Magasanikbacteria bacterium]